MGLTVGVAGLGAIGSAVARALAVGIPGLTLVAVSGRTPDRARTALAGLPGGDAVAVTDAAGLAERAQVVVETVPAAAAPDVIEAAVDAGRTVVTVSGAALLARFDLVDRAAARGGRIILATGALLGLDAVRAAAEGPVERIRLVTRKPPGGLAGAPYLAERGIDVGTVTAPTRVFAGSARDGARGFPANVNVAAALALAGIGPDRTELEIWADPTVTRNLHRVEVEAAAARFTMTIENLPSPDNPRTGLLTPLSVIACLRRLTAPLVVGS